MSHEIREHDTVLLHTKKAWHGYGQVIDEDLTALEALERCGLDWGVDQWPLVARGPDGVESEVDTHVLNVRSDTQTPLGIVGTGYQICANRELAQLADSLAKEGDRVVIETCGSLMDGRRVWFLLRAGSFSVRGDKVSNYICCSNGHDGGAAIRFSPTGIRVVCANTLSLVVPVFGKDDPSEVKPASFAARHSGNISEKLEDIRSALRLYECAAKTTEDRVNLLASIEVTSDQQLAELFIRNYQRDFPLSTKNPTPEQSERFQSRQTDALGCFMKRWDDERSEAGNNYWVAYNAYSGLVQHDSKARGRDDVARVERRQDSNLFGLNSQRTSRAFVDALELATRS